MCRKGNIAVAALREAGSGERDWRDTSHHTLRSDTSGRSRIDRGVSTRMWRPGSGLVLTVRVKTWNEFSLPTIKLTDAGYTIYFFAAQFLGGFFFCEWFSQFKREIPRFTRNTISFKKGA